MSETKQKKALGLIIGLVVVIAILAIMLCIAIFTPLFKSPKQQVMLALSKTFGNNSMIAILSGNNNNSDNSFSANDLLSINELRAISNSIKEGQYETSWSLTYEDASINGENNLRMLSGATISASCYSDKANRLFYGDYRIKYCGFKLLGAKLYIDDSEIAIADKDFFDGYLFFDTESFGKDFNNSDLKTLLGEDGDDYDLGDISFNVYDLLEQYSPSITNPLYDDASDFIKPLYDLYDAIEVEKSGNKQDYTIGDKTVHTTGYTVTIPAEALGDFASEFQPYLEDFLNNYAETFEKYASEGESPDFLNITFDGREYTVDEFDEFAEDFCDELYDYLSDMDDIEFEVFIDSKCRLIGVNYSYTFGSKNDDITLECEISFTGDQYLTDEMKGYIHMLDEDTDDEILVEFSNKTTIDDTIRNSILEIELSAESDSGKESFEITYEKSFDASNGDFDISLEFYAPKTKDSFTLFANGNISYDDASVSIEADSFGIEGNFDGTDNYIEFSGDYFISVLEDDIPTPTGKKYEIFDMSESELESLLLDVYDNIRTSTLGSLFL